MLSDVVGTSMTTVSDVVAAMHAIDRALPDDDGVKWFNFLYLTVTEAVQADEGAWRDWPFLQQFDVVFANLYFDAVRSWERDPRSTPRCWRPLLRARSDHKLARVQFALSGMNAHINHDLAIALEKMAQPDGRFPSRDSDRYADFTRVNALLERTEASLRVLLATGLVGHLDRALGDLDSLLVMWNVRKAREAAWTSGEVLWQLRGTPILRRDYLAKLDAMAGFAGRGLLLPRLGVAAHA